jgi:hypothetical protein
MTLFYAGLVIFCFGVVFRAILALSGGQNNNGKNNKITEHDSGTKTMTGGLI